MREKTRKLILSIFLAACIVALMAASLSYTLTNGRYTGGELSEDSPYDDIIDFVGATKYTVSTPEELVNAIENGYSYIEIAEDAPDPFVINSDIADVATNLVLNVNGHSLVRNSRNPLINVQKNVSVVLVYDSESIDESTPEEDMGGFYNPVGSALQASGGTLTVGQGKYESGPRSSVGSSYTLFTPNYLFTRTSRTADSYEKNADTSVQVPNITNKQDIYIQPDTTETNDYIKGDTYLIYTEEKNAYIPLEGENADKLIVNVEEKADNSVSGDKFSVPCNVASCDFYYYYPVAGTESTVGSGDQAQTVQTYAVVYGYNEVKSLAQTENETLTDANGREADNVLVWPYAAIRSEAGSAYARGGEFYTYFGTVNTYGIYSSGGIMTVGGEASADPEFSARGQGTCIYMAADESGDETDNILTIDSGTFSSEIGDTIKMFGGKMNVQSGTFTKSDDSADKTAIIHMTGGALTAAGSADASGKKSIQMTCAASAGTLSNVFGVYSEGGTVSLQNAEISVNGTDSACVLAEQAGSKVDLQSVSINLSGAQSDGKITSAAVNTLGGSITLSGSNQITSDGFGITAAADVSITGGETAVGSEEATLPTTAIYVFGGSLSVSTGATLSVHAEIDENLKWAGYEESTNAYQYDGVQVNGGSLQADGVLDVTFKGLENDNSGDYLSQQIKSYAVRVEQAASGGNTAVTIASGKITNSVGGGVYVGGGTVTLGDESTKTGPTVETTGKLLYASVTENGGWPWEQPTYEWGGWKYVVGSSWKYMLNKSGGHAVEVSGGSLTVHGGSYSAQQGNGILIRNTSGSQISNQVTINSGSFTGYNGGYYISYDNDYGYSGTPLGGDRMVGPAASYGLNVMGHDLNVAINGGSFGEAGETGNSAASFYGTSGGDRSDVSVYGGKFNANNADAISIFRYIDIEFYGANISSEISGSAKVASLSVQDDLLYTGDSGRGSTITLENGTFTGTAYGIWYACGHDRLSISGNATIQGEVGVQVAVAPVAGKGIDISGGTIEGSADGIYYNASASIDGEGYGLNITGGTIRGTANGNGHALNIAVAPRRHAISISGGELYGGRDTVYVSNAGGDEDAVSISGGTFTGAVADVEGSGDYGCAVWFNSGMNDSVYQFTGGTFITKNGGSAIYTSGPGRHYLRQIIPEGYSIENQNNDRFDRNWNFSTTLNGEHWLRVV